MIIVWDAPNNTGGADIVRYAVTIFPSARKADVVSSTTITVTAIDYNTEYRVSVVASNCIG